LQDKENLRSIFDMFGGQHSRAYVEQVYLQNAKETERTLDMFLTGNGLPKALTDSELVVEVKSKEPEEVINTSSQVKKGPSKDIRAYVLDEFKDILFPKQKN
jgi:hypothetical protein